MKITSENDNLESNVSNPFSTGSGGGLFEGQVQASFVVMMISKTPFYTLSPYSISKLQLQARYLQWNVDDIIIETKESDIENSAKLLCFIRHKVKITKGDKEFNEFIKNAWKDYNSNKFNKRFDKLVLITGPLSARDIDHTRVVLEWAKTSYDEVEFFTKINTAIFSSDIKKQKVEAFRHCVKLANEKVSVSDRDLFNFIKSIVLVSYDLDIQSSVVQVFIQAVLRSQENNFGLWSEIVKWVMECNARAATITYDSIPSWITNAYIRAVSSNVHYRKSKKYDSGKVHYSLSSEELNDLVIANLLGGWDEKSEKDKDAIARFVHPRTVDVWLVSIRSMKARYNIPLVNRDGHWSIPDRSNFWAKTKDLVHTNHIVRFAELALEILSEVSPRFELSVDRRWFYINEDKSMFSIAIREGVANTIALLKTQSKNIDLDHIDINSITSIVLKLFSSSSWKLWASLGGLVSILAEADSDIFLGELIKHLSQESPFLIKLFEEEVGIIVGNNYISAILLALESLAWIPKLLDRVVIVLGKLNELDPGTSRGNTPLKSLVKILLPWSPQTTALTEDRYAAVDKLVICCPETAWNTLLKLLPGVTTQSSDTLKPKWLGSMLDYDTDLDNVDDLHQEDKYANIAVKLAIDSFDRTLVMIDYIPSLTSTSFGCFCEYLQSNAISELNNKEKELIWTRLNALILKHLRFLKTNWAMSIDQIKILQSIADRFKANDSMVEFKFLFNSDDFDLYEEAGTYEQQVELLDNKRRDAIISIISTGGLNCVLQFAKEVNAPRLVGKFVAEANSDINDEVLLPAYLVSSNATYKAFAQGYVKAKFDEAHWPWVQSMINDVWKFEERSAFLTCLPFSRETWKYVEKWLCHKEHLYWKEVSSWICEQDDIAYAVDHLLKYERAADAVRCLYFQKIPDYQRIVIALHAAVNVADNIDSYKIGELVKRLQQSNTINVDDLFRIEWTYLPILQSLDIVPIYLESTLASKADFFCELIMHIYKSSKNSEKHEVADTSESQRKAETIYRLLMNWRTPPGSTVLNDKKFSFSALNEWLIEVVNIASRSGHLEVALSHVGEVFIYIPEDTDLFINLQVAKILDSSDQSYDSMRRGYARGIYNSRGVHDVDPSGKAEQELAAKWMNRANALESRGLLLFSSELRKLAKTYEIEAEEIITKFA